MDEYHKIQTVFKRDPENKYKTLLHGEYSLPAFEYLQHNPWVFTEKVDGTNIRIMFKDGKVHFAGKTDNAQLLASLVEKMESHFFPYANIFGAEEICLYCEGYGEKIQSGGKYREGQDVVLFDARVGKWWLTRDNVEEIAGKLNMDIVPIIGEGTLHDMVKMTADGFDSLWGNFTAEGIVARPKTELSTRAGNRIITKIKHKDF